MNQSLSLKEWLILILIGLLFAIAGCSKPADHGGEIAELRAQVAQIQSEQNSTNQSINSISAQFSQTLKLIETVQDQLADLIASNQANEYQVFELAEMIDSLQTIVTNQQAAVTQLSTGLVIAKVIDFCDTTPNQYNEVGFRLSDGSTVVFFEDKGHRFLSILKPSSSYQTTDGSKCSFTTNAAGLVCDNLGCR